MSFPCTTDAKTGHNSIYIYIRAHTLIQFRLTFGRRCTTTEVTTYDKSWWCAAGFRRGSNIFVLLLNKFAILLQLLTNNVQTTFITLKHN